jgi:transporter family-2 protein
VVGVGRGTLRRGLRDGGGDLRPRLGAATFISITIAGQVFVSILLDHFGVVGFAARPVTASRLLGALLLIAGVLMVRKF